MTRIRAILTPTDGLPGPDAAALRAEDAELNRRRLVWLLPVMTAVHVAHVFAFRVTPGEVLTAEVADWRTAVAFVHVVSAAVVGLLALATALLPPDRTTRFGAIAALVYLMHGAAIAAADQIHAPMVTPYMAYAIVTAMLLVLQPLEALVVYLPGAVAVTVALFAFQHDPELRRSMLFHGPSVTVAAVGLAGFLYHARVRDFVLRRTVARQQGELEAWNAELEARVDAQVAEIRAHAAEVETLNAQLKAQVRDRSRELTAALQKLQDRAPTTDTLVPGRVLADRFELRDTLGSGGMGAVYAGVDRVTGQPVAVKLVRADLDAPTSLLRRFLREAELVASLEHPAIVRMLHVDLDTDGTLFQVQELVRGETLAARLQRGNLGQDEVAGMLRTLADALATAHARGVVHRDVKPGNIMLTDTAPGVKLLDFGIARLRDDVTDDPATLDASSLETLTRVGAVIGTPGFMGPEQARGLEVGPRTDVYALGVVGWLALTGSLPPRGAVPGALGDVLRACLADDPDHRPDAAGLSARLSRLAPAPETFDDAPTSFPEDV